MTAEHDHTQCRELLRQFSDYIDGELETTLCAEIETHLAGCPDCQVMIDTMRKTITLYRRQTSAELPSDVEKRLYRILNLEE
jgi:anti-sigma factor RsiW